MALELLLRNTNFYPYRLFDMSYATLFPSLRYGIFGYPPNIYHESILWLETFVYRPETDRYTLITYHSIATWPSWEIWTTIIHPETGAIESHIAYGQHVVAHAWAGSAYNGGLGKLYQTYVSNGITNVTRPDLIPTAYEAANPVLTNVQVPSLAVSTFGHAVVPERNLLAINVGTGKLEVWDISANPAPSTLLHWQSFPETFAWGFGYENTENIWSLYSSSIFNPAEAAYQTLMKYNYYNNKVELITELQQGVSPDRGALIAFDTKRKKLAAVRIQADDADGAPNNAFEIYAPRPAMTQITVPVSIDTVAPDKPVRFRAHLLGTKAEGGALRLVTAENVHVDGILPKGEVYTTQSGMAEIAYVANEPAITDTLTVEYNETKVII